MSRKLDFIGRPADKGAGRISLDALRQGAEVTGGRAQVLDDGAQVVLIVANDGIQALGGVIEIFDKLVELTVIGHLTHMTGEERQIVNRLLERWIAQQPIYS